MIIWHLNPPTIILRNFIKTSVMYLRLKPHPIIHRARLQHLPLSVLLFTIVACECPRHFSVVLLKIALGELLSAYSLPVFVQICIVPSFFFAFAVALCSATIFSLGPDPLCASSSPVASSSRFIVLFFYCSCSFM
jgi:hypothetical protein